MTESRLKGKVVVVTGGARGIGLSVVEHAMAQGARVAIIDIDGHAAHQVAQRLARGDDAGPHVVVADISDEAQVRSAIADITSQLGVPDIWVNNAVRNSRTFDLLNTSLEDWEECLRVTLTGAFLCIREVLPSMIERRSGSIINISSVNASAMLGCDAYSAAKAGLNTLTRAVAVRYGGQGIRCNTVSPGSIATDQWGERLQANPHILDALRPWYPLGRIGTPADVAEAVVYLANADWVTGTEVVVDGGLLAGPAPMLPILEGTGGIPG